MLSLLALSLAEGLLALALQEPTLPAGLKNTEDPKNVPLPHEEALKLAKLPEGFRLTMFAGDPAVAQPISMAWDERGRLWVAECYTYESSGGPWNSPYFDRILIFEDADGDGRYDSRKIFTDKVKYVSSILPGHGGVWVCATPQLLFIPDGDRDDVPDGDPQVKLDGWNNGKIGHCVFNGLTWAPDGWLWGTQGIQGDSLVGKPGAADDARRKFNGGIWRYHPKREVFEVVAEGTTNPWGLDFDDHGQAFFTNCVIGHLWHVVPGGHYERMYGKDFTPNTYGLLKACSDHIHWGGGKWQDSRSAAGSHDTAGGGHAHAGAMVYLADEWPSAYRGTIFMNNLHGRRLNQDLLSRNGSGYVGKHGADFFQAGDPWYRGLGVLLGPDGNVVVADWQDVGECHDTKSVHRTSGRIWKIGYGAPKPPPKLDLAGLSDDALVQLQLHRNDWWVRQARRLLQERALAGKELAEAKLALKKILTQNEDVTRRLRALWCLHSVGGLDAAGMQSLLSDRDEHVRAWAVRFLAEAPSAELGKSLAELAAKEESALVRLFIASSLQRLPADSRWDALSALSAREDGSDPNLPLMIWYAAEPCVAADPARGLKLAAASKIPLLRQFVARRSAEGN